MSNKRFKIGDEVKVVSIKQNAPKNTIGMIGIITDFSSSLNYDYRVTFKNYYEDINSDTWFAYNDCDLEPANFSHAEPEMVEVTIKVPSIPTDKIPAGMKLGNPAYEYRLPQEGEWYCDGFHWHKSKFNFQTDRQITANFVPCEPEEPPFIDRKVESPYDMLCNSFTSV